MHRFYLPPEQCRQAPVFLSGREAHHALHVVRVQQGEQVVVVDGMGHELLCELGDYDRGKVRLSVIEKRYVEPLPWRITLIQALPKGKLIESIIQKATELGVARVIPVLSERVVRQLSTKEANKLAKWQVVAIEAIKQCGSAWLPRIEAPVSPEEFLARKETFDLALIASLQPDSYLAREYFGTFKARHGAYPKSLCIWVGPEGDFAPAEIEAIKAAGALPITLGRAVLRTETAAVFCLSILNYELQWAAAAADDRAAR